MGAVTAVVFFHVRNFSISKNWFLEAYCYFHTTEFVSQRDSLLFVSWKVFEAVIAWVNHDKDVRQELMARLMEHVRLPLLSREYLVQVSKKGILILLHVNIPVSFFNARWIILNLNSVM